MQLVVTRRNRSQPAPAPPPGVNPVLWQAYWTRGVRDANDLVLSLDRLTPVGTLEGIAAASEILIAHRERKILVVGDFDADGATSTALIVRCLRAFGFANVDFLVPN
ncbi:MAG: single-stranded-DNA-specific exonuclease RecJ, partial [Pseudomonadales bacterium]|nr:single-stranded-DNA-specific exonuclease RecJ [Pseudomonadales bacterium]